MAAGYDGTFGLTPFTLMHVAPNASLGILDGCYHVAGRGNGAENVVTIGGIDHLVVQNVFRTALGHYWALKLE